MSAYKGSSIPGPATWWCRLAAPAPQRRPPPRSTGGRSGGGGGRPGGFLGDARPNARPPTGAGAGRAHGPRRRHRIDVGLFADTLTHHAGAARIAKDIDGADLSGVTGTPTFFVNGRRHYGSFDIDALAAAVQTARARALVARQP